MKLIDCTKKATKGSSLDEGLGQLREKLPFLGKSSAQIQAMMLVHFQRGLDNRFTMIQNFVPEGQTRPIPFMLVGPPGVLVFNLIMGKGVYQIKEETWLELDKNTRKYHLAQVNLVKQTQALAQTVGVFLSEKGRAVTEVMPVLLFADAGVHIEQKRPAIRVVLADGIDRLIVSLVQANEVLNSVDVKRIADIFEAIAHPVTSPTGTEEDFFGKDLGLGVEKPKPKAPRPEPQIKLPPFLARLKFTRQQWIILVVILFLNILLLMAAILLVVLTAG